MLTKCFTNTEDLEQAVSLDGSRSVFTGVHLFSNK